MMKSLKINLAALLFVPFGISFFFFASATSSCIKSDSSLKQRLPNASSLVNNKIIFNIFIDEKTTQSPLFLDTPLYSYLSRQTYVIMKLGFFDSTDNLSKDTLVKLKLKILNGQIDMKFSDTLVLRSHTEYTILKIKTIDTTLQTSQIGFIIPKRDASAQIYTTYVVPNIKFMIPLAILPYNQPLYCTFVGGRAPSFFGYDEADFTTPLF